MSNSPQIIKVASKGKWESGVKTSLSIRDFSPFIMDEPESLGGTDEGANPMEYVLAALSGCTSVMIALIAQEQSFRFSGVEFENVGYIDLRGLMGAEGVLPHFQKVRFEVIISTEESDERIAELKAEVEKRCPVFNLLRDAGVPIEADWIKNKSLAKAN